MDATEKVIDKIRESRRIMSSECEHDPWKLVQYLKSCNGKYADQIERYAEMAEKPPKEKVR